MFGDPSAHTRTLDQPKSELSRAETKASEPGQWEPWLQEGVEAALAQGLGDPEDTPQPKPF